MAYRVISKESGPVSNLPSPLPKFLRDGLDAACGKLENDPDHNSRTSAGMLAFDGRLHEFNVADPANGFRYWVKVYFDIDEPQKLVGVTEIFMQPTYTNSG